MLVPISAGIAAFFHVGFFTLESVLWGSPAVRKMFGQTAEQAEATRLFAVNQGFYNLLLAAVVVSGLVLRTGARAALGDGMVLAGCVTMVGAGLVLILSSRGKLWRGAVAQTIPAALALVGLLLD